MVARHRVAIAGLIAGLVGGGVAGFALAAPGTAHGASSSNSSTPSGKSTPNAAAPTTPGAARDEALHNALDPLVKNHTITQQQEDAVISALEQARPSLGNGFKGGPRPAWFGIFGDAADAAAKALGITTTQLRTDLANGQSIAAIAKSKHVDVNKVIDAIVAAEKSHLDNAVKNKHMTSSDEAKALANLRSMVTNLVNLTPPALGSHSALGHLAFPFGGHFGDKGGPGSANNNSGSAPAGAPKPAVFFG
jgi:hypothetical protein